MDFSHHVNPFRHLDDAIQVRAEVDAPVMDEIEEQAFKESFSEALGETLGRLRWFYDRKLVELKQKKEEGPPDEGPSSERNFHS